MAQHKIIIDARKRQGENATLAVKIQIDLPLSLCYNSSACGYGEMAHANDLKSFGL